MALRDDVFFVFERARILEPSFSLPVVAGGYMVLVSEVTLALPIKFNALIASFS